MKNILQPLSKSVLVPLRLKAAASATDAATHNKIFGSGMPTLIISNEEINEIMKIGKALEESGCLIKELVKQSEMNKKMNFLESFRHFRCSFIRIYVSK